MRFGLYPVKDSSHPAKSGSAKVRWLDGWVLMFPSVGVALLGAFLALPQGTMPDYLPLPRIAAGELDTARHHLEQQADAAYAELLGYDVRAAGESFRQLGRIAHQGQAIGLHERNRFRELLRRARETNGVAGVLRLRAVEARMFQLALIEWERTGNENVDLIELAGDFLAVARTLGWTKEPTRQALPAHRPPDHAAPRARHFLKLDSDERTALFLARWTDLAGLDADPSMRLAPVWSLLVLRARLRLPLAELGQRDLKLIERVKMFDATYPEALGKGLILARTGDVARAAQAFRMQLQEEPDGPYTLRARNHLQYVLANSADDGR